MISFGTIVMNIIYFTIKNFKKGSERQLSMRAHDAFAEDMSSVLISHTGKLITRCKGHDGLRWGLRRPPPKCVCRNVCTHTVNSFKIIICAKQIKK